MVRVFVSFYSSRDFCTLPLLYLSFWPWLFANALPFSSLLARTLHSQTPLMYYTPPHTPRHYRMPSPHR